jgi:hypothetical protein
MDTELDTKDMDIMGAGSRGHTGPSAIEATRTKRLAFRRIACRLADNPFPDRLDVAGGADRPSSKRALFQPCINAPDRGSLWQSPAHMAGVEPAA